MAKFKTLSGAIIESDNPEVIESLKMMYGAPEVKKPEKPATKGETDAVGDK